MQIFGSVLNRDFPKLTSLSFSLRPSLLRHVMYTIVDRYYMTMKERLGASLLERVTDILRAIINFNAKNFLDEKCHY
jgi:hypothetical protein